MGPKDERRRLAKEKLGNRNWRLDNLYYIINKQGEKVRFKTNWAQKEVFNNIHNNNIILKARQLGISTFICILFLDTCLFNSNVSAGIIAHRREDAQKLFEKVKFAFDNLPEGMQAYFKPDTSTVGMLKFPNNSTIRIDTSIRS